ncbi:MAG: DNA starvation/stationary phase protection protein [Burkholderiaceae bacterium]|jgi:starvation-inducible DNA-binding protein|nr:DNA starvation/stationary phase protection protein [Burkholderiaceae bacterium]
MSVPAINIGISEKDRENISQGLSRVLTESFVLYLKTHSYHWNVTGPMFRTLHILFEEQYTELWAALDEIAERIRSLGFFATGMLTGYNRLAASTEKDIAPNADEMIRDLINGSETVSKISREVLAIADKAGDDPTVDLLTNRMQVHEKNAWMLRSLLDTNQATVPVPGKKSAAKTAAKTGKSKK